MKRINVSHIYLVIAILFGLTLLCSNIHSHVNKGWRSDVERDRDVLKIDEDVFDSSASAAKRIETDISNSNGNSDSDRDDGITNRVEREVTTRSGARCLTFNETLDNLVSSSTSVFVTMPAKGAGSSMKKFTRECVGEYGIDNIINTIDEGERTDPFHENIVLPKIIASHAYIDSSMVNLMKNVGRQSLILYIHRDETDRLISAIRHVVQTRVCRLKFLEDKIDFEVNGSQCIVTEKSVTNYVIATRPHEISNGSNEIMTCDFYDAIEEHFPRLVFVHYKQVSKVHQALAKHYCTHMLDKQWYTNVSSKKNKVMQVYLRLEKDGEKLMPLDDWLEAKRDMLEWTFQLRANSQCQAKTKSMEDELFSCEDELLQVTRSTSF